MASPSCGVSTSSLQPCPARSYVQTRVVRLSSVVIRAHPARRRSETVLEHDGGAAGSRAVQVQAVTADVVQGAGRGVGVPVVCPGSGFVHPADGADGERGDDRVDQPADAAAEAAAELDDHPDREREHHRWPDPTGRVERSIVGPRDQQREPCRQP